MRVIRTITLIGICQKILAVAASRSDHERLECGVAGCARVVPDITGSDELGAVNVRVKIDDGSIGGESASDGVEREI